MSWLRTAGRAASRLPGVGTAATAGAAGTNYAIGEWDNAISEEQRQNSIRHRNEMQRIGAERQGLNLDGTKRDAGYQEAQAAQTISPTTGFGGGGGGGTQGPVLNNAAIDATRQGLSALDTRRQVGLDSIRGGYNELTGRYDQERTQNRADFDRQNLTNEQNLQKNRQNSLTAGAQGLRGLRGTLASLGALGGDGSVLANRAATTAVNQDLGGADDAYAQNAQELGNAWGRFETEDDRRRAEAETARRNQERALSGDIAGQRQGIYQRLAELYAQGGNEGRAADYLGRAAGLHEDVARGQGVDSTPFTPGQAAFTPESLQSYLAGAGDMRVNVGGQGGQSVLAGNELARRGRGRGQDEEEERQF